MMKHLLIKTTIRFIYNSNIENIIFFNLKNKNLIIDFINYQSYRKIYYFWCHFTKILYI